MLTGATVQDVIAGAKAGGVVLTSEGELDNESNLQYSTNAARLAQTFNLTLLLPQSWLPEALADLVDDHGPLMIDTLWNVGTYVQGIGSPGHMRVIAGMRGDGTADGTTVLLYDPWRPTHGHIESVIYGPFIRKDPASTYQIFYR